MSDARANPFKMPTDEEVFILRDKEKQQKAIERERLKYQRVHEKTTWSSKIGTALSQRDKLGHENTKVESKSASHMDVQLPTIDAREKDNMSEYIQKKRKMGLVRMSLSTKRQEIKKLDEEAERALKRVTQQEEQLKETEDKFQAFLKHSNIEQVEAMKRAENESKAKQERMQEIKKLSAQIAQIEADKKKNEEQMLQCFEFKEFLDLLTPQPWIKETLYNLLVEDKRNEITMRKEALFQQEETTEGATDQEEAERRGQMVAEIEEELQFEAQDIAERLEEDEPETIKADLDSIDPSRVPMYFTDPDAILKRFMEIEEGNLFLIQTCQELEEEIEDIAQKYQQEQNEMIQIAQQRKTQMEGVNKKIIEESGKMKGLTERIERAQEGGSGPTQDQLKMDIEEKVKAIYRSLSNHGDESNINTLSMLTNIEMKLEEMRLQIKNPSSGIDDAFVLMVMKQRDKERRRESRQILLNKQREERERRSKLALARSQAPVKKRVGKPVMWRSRPLDRKKKETVTTTETVNEDDEFFM